MRTGISFEKGSKKTLSDEKRPESLLEKVSMNSDILRAAEVISERVAEFKSHARQDLLDIEDGFGSTRHELAESRSNSGVLLRLDALFLRAETLSQEFQSFLFTKLSHETSEVFSFKLRRGKPQ